MKMAIEDLEFNNINLHLLYFEDSAVYMMLYVTGMCQGCDSLSNMFDKEASDSSRLDVFCHLQDTNDSSACICPIDVPSQSSTEEEFVQESSMALKGLSITGF